MSQSPYQDPIADQLIAAHDGDVALLYIYLRRRGEDLEGAARELCRTMDQIRSAREKLQRMGLWPSASQGGAAPSPMAEPPATVPEPAEELPEYRTEDVMRRSREDPGFAAVTAEAQRVLGHVLSGPDLKKLFGIYDYLALPPEVILLLLNHCVELSSPRRPSMRYIEKQAYRWVNQEISTLERAEEHIRRQRDLRELTSRARLALGIRDRELTTTERRYVEAWLDMGFGPDCLEIAYDRTVTNTGSLKWNYMNKILLSWHEKGIHSPKELEEKEGRRSAPSPGRRGEDKPLDLGKLRELTEKL